MAKEDASLMVAEEYYQISPEMLGSFPKYRLPLPVFRYKEEVAQLQLFIARDQRMTNEQVEELHELAKTGGVFVSRSDYPIYSKHIIKQLDLILSDSHLKQSEITYICVKALTMRLQEYLEQPVKIVGERLMADTLVFTEYISNDPFRIKSFLNRLERVHTLAAHSVNTLLVGIWLYLHSVDDKKVNRKELDRYSLGFLLHDVGMSKVASFILQKTTLLKQEEKDKIPSHTMIGAKMVHKLEFGWDELISAAFEHHERMNGSGYPRKLSGEQISKMGRLCAIADSFSAMITERPYASAKDPFEAAQEIANDSRYDPRYSSLLRNALVTKEITMIPPQEPESKA